MPAPLDKDKVRLETIKAFQKIAEKKPLPQISLRDVANEMGVSHGRLLYYFKSKDELLIACSRWAGEQFCAMISGWFKNHLLKDYASEKAYYDAFFAYSIGNESNETVPRAVVMTCVMGDYSEGLKDDIKFECDSIRRTLKQSIEKSTARKLSDADSQAMFVLLFGAYFCAFNGAMDGYNLNTFSCMGHLLETIG